MARPAKLLFVTGTGTEVGKTWVGAALLREARRAGLTVSARKPLQSFSPGDRVTDAVVLAEATGEPPSSVCPPERSYPAPMAPPMAGAALGRPVPSLTELVGWLESSMPECDLALVEGAGGVASPLGSDCDNVGLARALRPDLVVLVADPVLGAINSVRLCMGALAMPAVVHLNRFEPADDLHRRNLAWLEEEDHFTVTTSVGDLLALV